METLKEAIITYDNKIKCPYCLKTNGIVTGEEYVKNFKMRCRGSRRGLEHFFVLNVGDEEVKKA